MNLAKAFGSANKIIAANAGSLAGTTAVTSVLGAIFWWLAARQYVPSAVGVCSAAVSAMQVLAIFAAVGLGTLLIGELQRASQGRGGLIMAALLVSAVAGAVLGLVFLVLAPAISAELAPIAESWVSATLFVVGVVLTAVTVVFDQATIGLLRGDLQLVRNVVFAVTKVALLVLVCAVSQQRGWSLIFGTWVAGLVLSLIVMAAMAVRRSSSLTAFKPRMHRLRGLQRSALEHHGLNLALQAPSLALPVLVTAVLSATTNAYFYVAWMIASFVFVIPVALTTALYAVGAKDPNALATRMRFTLRTSTGLAVVAILGIGVLGPLVLGLFGDAYRAEVGNGMLVLSLAVVPLIVKNHYVAIARVRGALGVAFVICTIGAVLEFGLAAFGGTVGGLMGLALGWFGATVIEGLMMAPLVWREVKLRRAPAIATDTVD